MFTLQLSQLNEGIYYFAYKSIDNCFVFMNIHIYLLLQKPKVNVMIRCRTGSDFCYSEEEMDTMISDVEYYKTLKIDRFVFGALTLSQTVDEKICLKIVTLAHPTPVTFHRAFDMCKNPHTAMEQVIKLGFDRVLTSGQQPSAGDPNAIDLLKKIVSKYSSKIEIMPGAGVTAENGKKFMIIGCRIVHSSCKKLKQISQKENNLSMGTNSIEYIYYTDENIVKKLIMVLSA